MEIYNNPPREQWTELTQRALADEHSQVTTAVADIMQRVRTEGDAAILELEHRFTGSAITSLKVAEAEIDRAEATVSSELKDAIALAAHNIEMFHRAQVPHPVDVETAPGVSCWQRAIPIERVGLYIPGGNSPLFSTVLMLAIPARIAGCRQVVLCTPANSQGEVSPAILYAAKVAGVHAIYKAGGAQAIAAMTFGTAEVPRVYKIFGPGNRYVMEAKQQAAMCGVAIDMPAGPSEVMVVADECADPAFVAADFLSQAEHGPDSQSILLTTDASLADKVPTEIERLLNELPNTELARKSLSHSRIIIFANTDDMLDFANTYAPEHLILNHSQASELTSRVVNAGSVFVGAYSTESAGDYASGTNHTLPTSGYATAYSGVNLDSFNKKITYQHLTPMGVRSIGHAVEVMAEAEGLYAHKLAMTLRLNKVNS
jgi:histidinol dehydrogenase